MEGSAVISTTTATTMGLVIPLVVLTVTSAITLRRSLATLINFSPLSPSSQGIRNEETDDEGEQEYVEGEEDILPKPEPLGGSMAPPKKISKPSLFQMQSHNKIIENHSPTINVEDRSTATIIRSNSAQQILFAHEKAEVKVPPMDMDAVALRAKLIDADAAKRRALTRLAELERETENLKRRCAELEHKSSMAADGMQQLSVTQRLVSIVLPQLKARRRAVMWKT
jgi:hypothetical protein